MQVVSLSPYMFYICFLRWGIRNCGHVTGRLTSDCMIDCYDVYIVNKIIEMSYSTTTIGLTITYSQRNCTEFQNKVTSPHGQQKNAYII